MAMQSKCSLDIALVGDEGQGKSTLAAALSAVLAERFGGGMPLSYDEIRAPGEDRLYSISSAAAMVECETAASRYYVHDWPTRGDLVRGLAIKMVNRPDAVVLVTSAAAAPTPDAREQLRLMRQAGATHAIAFVNRCDVTDAGSHEAAGQQAQALLGEAGFICIAAPITGSAKLALAGDTASQGRGVASIVELAAALDAAVPKPAALRDRPFLMRIDGLARMTGKGVLVLGRVERGCAKLGDDLELARSGSGHLIRLGEVGMFSPGRDENSHTFMALPGAAIEPGDQVAVVGAPLLVEADTHDGYLLAAPGTVPYVQHLAAEIVALEPHNSGSGDPVLAGTPVDLSFRTWSPAVERKATLRWADGSDVPLAPGTHRAATVVLDEPLPLHSDLIFTIRANGRVVGAGAAARQVQ